MFHIRTCCFCFTLPTAALFVGWVNIITSSANIITGLYGTENTDKYIKRYTSDVDMSIETQRVAYQILWTFLIVTSVIRFSASVCLIFGTMKRNRFLLIPHLCIEIAGMLILITIIGIYCVWIFIDYNPENLFTIVVLCLALGLNFYLYCCIQSLYKSLWEDEKNLESGDVDKIVNSGLPVYGTLF